MLVSQDPRLHLFYISPAARRHPVHAPLVCNAGSTDEEVGFYEAKIQTSAFVFEHLLPRTRMHKKVMLAPLSSLVDMQIENFSFDHAR